jgi:hypothetical protein
VTVPPGHVPEQAHQRERRSGARARESAETSFLDDCSDEDWRRIGSYCVQRRFEPGEEVVRQGEVDRALVIILSGSLDLFKRGPDLVPVFEARPAGGPEWAAPSGPLNLDWPGNDDAALAAAISQEPNRRRLGMAERSRHPER